MQRKTKFSLAGAAIALIATVAVAAGFDQINSGYLKIGNGAASTKTLEFNVGNTTSDPIITGDSSNNLSISAASTRLLELPANGVNYVELKVPTALAGNTTLTLPGTAPGASNSFLSATTAGLMSWIACGSSTTLVHGGSSPACAAVTLTTDVTGTLPVGNGGTSIAAGTSGGIPYFASTSAMASSGALTANGIVLGGGAATTPTTTAACTGANTVLRGGSPPACGSLVNADIPTTLTGKTLSGNTATNLVSGSGTLTLNTSGTITAPNVTDTLAVKGANTFTAAQTISDTTDASSSTVGGALTDSGGLAVAKKLYVGTNVTAGTSLIGDHTFFTSTTGHLTVDVGYTASGSNNGLIVQRNGGAVVAALGYDDSGSSAMYFGTLTAHALQFKSNTAVAGSISNAGSSAVWTLGASGATVVHVINGQLQVTSRGANSSNVAANFTAGGVLSTVTSSRRYKKNIVDIGQKIDSSKIFGLRPVEFDYKNEDKPTRKMVGMIAEEVESVIPNMVVYNDKHEPDSIYYQDLPILLLKELQKLRAEFDEYKKLNPHAESHPPKKQAG